MSTTETRSPESSTSQRPEPAAKNTPPWAIVTLREVMVKARDRSYLISTLVTLVLIIGAVVFNAYMANRGTDYTVAVAGGSGQSVVETAGENAAADDNTTFEAVPADSPEEARDLVSNGDADAALLQDSDGAWTLVGNEEIDGSLRSAVAEALRLTVINDNAEAAGTTSTELLAGSISEYVKLFDRMLKGHLSGSMDAHQVEAAYYSYMKNAQLMV